MKITIKYFTNLVKEAKIRKRRRSVLDESIKYFNSNTRALVEGKCVYSPTDTSEGCAVGRLIKDKELCNKFDVTRTGVCGTVVWSALPKEIQELGGGFLQELQGLHDTGNNWDIHGLTRRGLDHADRIRKAYT